MSDAPKRGRGRPRKYANPEAGRLVKNEYNKARYQKLMKQPIVESDNDEPSTPSTLVYQGPIGPTKDLTPPPPPPHAPVKDPNLPNSKDESLPNLLLNGDDNNDDGGHIVDSSTGGHIDEDGGEGWGGYTSEDIYGVSDGEQEVRRVAQDQESDSNPQDAQEGQDNHQVSQSATRIENQAWISHSALAPQSLGVDLDELVPIDSDSDEQVPMDLNDLVPMDLDDSVATRLIEQLYSFHGCTDNAHDIQDDEYAKFQDSYTSLADISSFQAPGNSIPDVLSVANFIESQDLCQDLDPIQIQQLYEGRTPSVEPRGEPNPPKKLHLPHRPLERQNPHSKITYDIDGLCLFPTSLGVAQQGLYWQPTSHRIMNIASDLHFTLPADAYNAYGGIERVRKPLHQIVHCCLGALGGFEGLLLYAFFPSVLHPNLKTTYLTNDLQSLWLDGLFLPALYRAHEGEDGLLQHFPASYAVAQANAISHSAERSSFDSDLQVSRTQLLKYFIQPEKLPLIWDYILEAIQGNPAFADFHGVTLFATAKDLKYRYMSTSLATMCSKWEQQYKWAVNPKFQARDQAFIDLGKQVTAQGSYLYPCTIPGGQEPQTYILKRCCLKSFVGWFCKRSTDRKGKKKEDLNNKKPEMSLYSVALMEDATNLTLNFPIGSKERQAGLVFHQVYSESYAPFNAAKVAPFENTRYENLAVDPSLVEAIEYAGGAMAFNPKTCERGYLNSKNRANQATLAARYKSYGTREEDRISLELFDIVQPKLTKLLQRKEPVNHDYYYAIPSQTLFSFLRSQINKFCFGFEHLYMQGTMVQWEKSQLMVYFLRMLRLCFRAHELGRERELYRDKWTLKSQDGTIEQEKEGLGIQNTISDYGLAWFLPKIDWAAWNLLPDHAPRMVFDHPHIQKIYRQRWQPVRAIVEGSTLVDEAQMWARRFDIASNRDKGKAWLEYLFAVNLQLFNECVGSAIKEDLKPEYLQRGLAGQIPLCFDELAIAYAIGPPHLVAGNRMKYSNGPMELVDYLFDFEDNKARGGWAKTSYRLVYQRTLGLVEEIYSKAKADEWS